MHSSHIPDNEFKSNYKNSSNQNTASTKGIPTSPRNMPTFLEGKNNLKASLIMEDIAKSSSSSQLHNPKRAPRMSEHVLPSEMRDFNDPRKPPFLSKNEKEPIFKKKNISGMQEKNGSSNEKDNRKSETTASSFRSFNR